MTEHDTDYESAVGVKTKKSNMGVMILLFMILVAVVLQPWLSRLILPASAEAWAYKIAAPADLEFEATMNELGKEGWELVSARRARDSYTEQMMYECIFKRKK